MTKIFSSIKWIKAIFTFILHLILCLNIAFSQHYKKNGTLDKRYKSSQAPTRKTSSAHHLKKDGTADKRYKENKSYSSSSSSTNSQKAYPYKVVRDKNGRIKRSSTAKHTFMKQTGYPHGRTGYVVDHIVPLKKGGCDCPANMQWQTKEAAKEKDKWE